MTNEIIFCRSFATTATRCNNLIHIFLIGLNNNFRHNGASIIFPKTVGIQFMVVVI